FLTATTHGLVVPFGFWLVVATTELTVAEIFHSLALAGRWHAVAFPVTFALAYYVSRWFFDRAGAASAT
ncbi:MAG: hypothetical protein AAFR07_16085, partial [Pseudomonadota bacterium]